MPTGYDIQSPLGAGLESLSKILVQQEVQKRQEMIDEITRRNVESQIKDRDTNRKVQEQKAQQEHEDRQAKIKADSEEKTAHAAKEREDKLAKMLTMPPAYMQDITGTEIASLLPDYMKTSKDGKVLFSGTPEMTVGHDPDFEKALKDGDRATMYTILTRHGVKFSEVGAKIDDMFKNANQQESVFWQDPRTKKIFKYDDNPNSPTKGTAIPYAGAIPKGSRILNEPDMRPTQVLGIDPATGELAPIGGPVDAGVKPRFQAVSATQQNKEIMSHGLRTISDQIKKTIDENKEFMGPLVGRTVSEFLGQKVGDIPGLTDDQKQRLAKFQTKLQNFTTGFASIHGRGVGANVGIANKLHQDFLNMHMDPSILKGNLEGFDDFLDEYGRSPLDFDKNPWSPKKKGSGGKVDVDAIYNKLFPK